MLSPKFKEAVRSRNVLRTRIMIKDAFVTDPSCALVDEMLQYAKDNGLKIMEPYDGSAMKRFSSEWNRAALNDELAKLMNNFSENRIRNLRSMTKIVLGAQGNKNDKTTIKQKAPDDPIVEALATMRTEGGKIKTVLECTEAAGKKWTKKDVDDMETAANRILNAVRQYRQHKHNLPTKR